MFIQAMPAKRSFLLMHLLEFFLLLQPFLLLSSPCAAEDYFERRAFNKVSEMKALKRARNYIKTTTLKRYGENGYILLGLTCEVKVKVEFYITALFFSC